MPIEPIPQITDIQRYDGGVLIVYDNGRHFHFSAKLLVEISPRAQNLTEPKSDD